MRRGHNRCSATELRMKLGCRPWWNGKRCEDLQMVVQSDFAGLSGMQVHRVEHCPDRQTDRQTSLSFRIK